MWWLSNRTLVILVIAGFVIDLLLIFFMLEEDPREQQLPQQLIWLDEKEVTVDIDDKLSFFSQLKAGSSPLWHVPFTNCKGNDDVIESPGGCMVVEVRRKGIEGDEEVEEVVLNDGIMARKFKIRFSGPVTWKANHFESPFEFITVEFSSSLRTDGSPLTSDSFIAGIIPLEGTEARASVVKEVRLLNDWNGQISFKITVEHQGIYRNGDQFWLGPNHEFWAQGKSQGNAVRLEVLTGVFRGSNLQAREIHYNLDDSESLPWWLSLEPAHVGNILHSLSTLHFFPPFPRKYYSSLPHFARLEHYAHEVSVFLEKERKQPLGYFQVDHVEYWADYSQSWAQRAILSVRSATGNSDIIAEKFEVWDDYIHTRKIQKMPPRRIIPLSIVFLTTVESPEQLRLLGEVFQSILDMEKARPGTVSLCVLVADHVDISQWKTTDVHVLLSHLHVGSSLKSCPWEAEQREVVCVFQPGVTFSPGIAEEIEFWTTKNRRAYSPEGFLVDELPLEDLCDETASELCNYPKSWKKDSLSLIALYREDFLAVGGMAEISGRAENDRLLIQSASSFLLTDIFFRIRAYGGLSVVRPSDSSVFIKGPAAHSVPPFLAKEFGWNLQRSFEEQRQAPWRLKLAATFSTSLPVYQDYAPEYAFDEEDGTYFWASRSLDPGDFFQLDLEVPFLCKEVRIFTGARTQLFNWLRLGFLEISLDGKKFRKVFVFLNTSNGVARVTFKERLLIKSLKIVVAERQDAWLVIEDIVLLDE